MLGLGLGEVVLAVCLFSLAAYLIYTFGKEPWKNWGLWILGAFAVIYLVERLRIYEWLQKIMI